MARVLPAEGVWAGRLAWLALALSVGAVLGGADRGDRERAGGLALPDRLHDAALRLFRRDRGRAAGRRGDRPDAGSAEQRRLWAIMLALLSRLRPLPAISATRSWPRSLPAIHDISTDLDDMPQFRALKVRADNLENPDEGRPELAAMEPESAGRRCTARLWRPADDQRALERVRDDRPRRPWPRSAAGRSPMSIPAAAAGSDRHHHVLPLQGRCRDPRRARSGAPGRHPGRHALDQPDRRQRHRRQRRASANS
jgi:hypothetical protein